MQSKGGVGATTLALETLRLIPAPAALVETGGQGVLSHVLPDGVKQADAGVYTRMGTGMSHALAAERGEMIGIGCEPLSYALYGASEIARVALAAGNFRFVVCDAGRCNWPHPPAPEILGYATHIWLVITPDVRSVAQAEAFLAPRPELHGRVTLVENFASGDSLVTKWPFKVVRLPDMPATPLGSLRSGAYEVALETALAEVFPAPEQPMLRIKTPEEPGLLRSLMAGMSLSAFGRSKEGKNKSKNN